MADAPRCMWLERGTGEGLWWGSGVSVTFIAQYSSPYTVVDYFVIYHAIRTPRETGSVFNTSVVGNQRWQVI